MVGQSDTKNIINAFHDHSFVPISAPTHANNIKIIKIDTINTINLYIQIFLSFAIIYFNSFVFWFI